VGCYSQKRRKEEDGEEVGLSPENAHTYRLPLVKIQKWGQADEKIKKRTGPRKELIRLTSAVSLNVV